MKKYKTKKRNKKPSKGKKKVIRYNSPITGRFVSKEKYKSELAAVKRLQKINKQLGGGGKIKSNQTIKKQKQVVISTDQIFEHSLVDYITNEQGEGILFYVNGKSINTPDKFENFTDELDKFLNDFHRAAEDEDLDSPTVIFVIETVEKKFRKKIRNVGNIRIDKTIISPEIPKGFSPNEYFFL